MEVSIIIPMYNASKTIERCIESIINSINNDVEIILIDDGSKDDTRKVCKKYSTTYKNIFYYYQSHAGVSAARYYGVLKSRGKYISFVDADDWCTEDRYKVLSHIITSIDAEVILFGALEYKHGKNTKKILNCSLQEGLYETKDMLNDYIYPLFGRLETDKKECSGYLWNTVILRERLLEIDFLNQLSLMEDEVIILQVILKSSKIYVCNKYLYYYDKTNRNSLSRKKGYWNNYWDEILKIYVVKKRIGKENLLDANEYQNRLGIFLVHNYLRSISNETYYDNPNNILARLMILRRMNSNKVLSEIGLSELRNLKNIEKKLLWLATHKLSVLVYFYYLIKYDNTWILELT